jgi:hypothetical protein
MDPQWLMVTIGNYTVQSMWSHCSSQKQGRVRRRPRWAVGHINAFLAWRRMAGCRPVPNRANRSSDLEDRVFERLSRRIWPIAVSVAFVILGLAYFFRWGPVVRHTPSLWISPGDLWTTYRASSVLTHGHFGAIYAPELGFLAFPAILIALAPLGALNNVFSTTLVQIRNNGHLLAHPVSILASGTPLLLTDPQMSGAKQYVGHPQAFVFLAPYVLVLACISLFAFDALAERLQVSKSRRAVLSLAEAVVLWNVTVLWGHPEDAVAVALAVYALIFAMDERFIGAGWLFGVAVAVQPLVIVILPILLVMAGKSRALGFVIRSIVPAAVITIAPLASDFHATVRALVTQPTFPNNKNNHQSPWTFLAPKLGGHGAGATVGGGPVRVLVLALAAGVGWWAIRWRERPEMIVWAAALALALRIYTESVTTAYYVWPALAVGLVVAARGSQRRFGIAIAVAVATTVFAQWNLGVFPWWAIDVVGVTVLLVAAGRPEPIGPSEERVEQGHARTNAVQRRAGPATSKKRKRKAARTDRKRSARH